MVNLPVVRIGVMMVLSWLASIGDAIGILVQFVSTTISGILSVFALVGQCFAFLGVAWAVLPSVLLVFCVAGISIVIVFQFIGR